LDGLKLLN
jgi:hypothetical protein